MKVGGDMMPWTTHVHVDVFVVEDSDSQLKPLRTADRVRQFETHKEGVECPQL